MKHPCGPYRVLTALALPMKRRVKVSNDEGVIICAHGDMYSAL